MFMVRSLIYYYYRVIIHLLAFHLAYIVDSITLEPQDGGDDRTTIDVSEERVDASA